MNISDIRKLYAYTEWANEKMLEPIAALSDEQFTREIVASFSSIRDTLSHIASSERIWLQRWLGESLRVVPEWAKAPSFHTAREQLHAVAADRREYLARLTDGALTETFDYVSLKGDPFSMPLGETLVHCANHSTYHRGQLVTMLRQVGATPPGTDYTLWVRATAAPF
jgi:uncharacterized damage-inducible protein DinB